MKIKTKKHLNLPQLIEWGFNNDVTNQYFRANDARGNISEVYFNVTGLPQFSSMVDKQDTFTVEVEEEITEDTELFLVERFTDSEGNICYQRHRKGSIKNNIENNPSYFKTTHIYTEVNEELILIWTREKGLVE